MPTKKQDTEATTQTKPEIQTDDTTLFDRMMAKKVGKKGDAKPCEDCPDGVMGFAEAIPQDSAA